jgi:DNA anti-recombination protein RmuC
VRTLADPVALVEQLRGVRYTWTESGQADVGVIAEEVAKVLPEVVAFEEDGQARGVNYGKLVSVLIEATKAQQQEIESLRGRVERLEQLIRQRAASSAPENTASPTDTAAATSHDSLPSQQ